MDKETRNLILIGAGVAALYYFARKAAAALAAPAAAAANAAGWAFAPGVMLTTDPTSGAGVPVRFPNGHTYSLPAGLFTGSWFPSVFGYGSLTVDAANDQGIPPGSYTLKSDDGGQTFYAVG